ncbi:MAG: hypothetical protein JOS17DRAFT_831841 [Linnemannia elongata]|nr:MAG: hypothetical protein JOS17DRAFT_831841 [Linnemannia elongata]
MSDILTSISSLSEAISTTASKWTFFNFLNDAKRTLAGDPIITTFITTSVTPINFITKIFQTHPLDLPEIRSRIARSLGLRALASCARVSQDWNDLFTPPLYKTVVLSKHHLSVQSVERHKHLTQHLTNGSFAYEELSLTPARDDIVSSVMANSTLTTLNFGGTSTGDNVAEALSEALKTNLTLTNLSLFSNSIGSNAAQALSEALKATQLCS